MAHARRNNLQQGSSKTFVSPMHFQQLHKEEMQIDSVQDHASVVCSPHRVAMLESVQKEKKRRNRKTVRLIFRRCDRRFSPTFYRIYRVFFF